MDRRTLLFITISVGIILAYQELVLKRLMPPKPGAGQTQSAPDTTGERSGEPTLPAERENAAPNTNPGAAGSSASGERPG